MYTRTTADAPLATRSIALLLGLTAMLLVLPPTAMAEQAKAESATTEAKAAPEVTPEAAPEVEPADGPRSIVAARYEQIKGICAETIDEEKMREKIKALTVDFVDYEEFSRLTIKRAWKDLSASQRTEFVEWFQRLIQATYARHFKPRQDIAVTYRGETKYKGEKAQVQTTLQFEKSAVDVDYRFHKHGVATDAKAADWWVYDLVIDEVSLMRNYRGQFRKILKKDGFEALMAKVRDAVKRKESADDSSNEL